VGRLDLTSEGLLLLTNDGELKRKLEHPSTGWARRYRVRVHGRVTDDALAKLAKGMTVDGIRYGPIQATLDTARGANSWLTMTLREGKNREIRKVCEALGWTVNRLIRVSYGPFQLGNLKRSEIEEGPARVLAEQTGDTPKGKDRPARLKAKKPAGGKPPPKSGQKSRPKLGLKSGPKSRQKSGLAKDRRDAGHRR
jgi:23S rRNA pseudouridine2605 synthase